MGKVLFPIDIILFGYTLSSYDGDSHTSIYQGPIRIEKYDLWHFKEDLLCSQINDAPQLLGDSDTLVYGKKTSQPSIVP